MSQLQSITTLPLLNLSQLDAGPQQRQQFLDELRSAARHIGFFYLTGHGIDPALLAQVQQQARAFFALPEADKLAVGMIHSPHFRGYNRAASIIERMEKEGIVSPANHSGKREVLMRESA